MGKVLRLDEYRQGENRPSEAPAPEGPLLYHCERCRGREFTLHASGVTYCVDCGALMRNLFVVSVAS
jgi:hypothetical protein